MMLISGWHNSEDCGKALEGLLCTVDGAHGARNSYWTHRTVHLAVGPHERLKKRCASADIKCGCEASLCTGGPHSCWGLRRTHAGTFRTGSIN